MGQPIVHQLLVHQAVQEVSKGHLHQIMSDSKHDIDIDAVERVIKKSIQKLDVAALAGILADAFEHVDIDAKAAKYLQGPTNCIGTELPNAKTRNVIQNCAQVICLNGPPNVNYERVRNRLVMNLDHYYVSLDKAINEELDDPNSLYPEYLLSIEESGDRSIDDTDKMKAELLGKYMERRILTGQTKFLIDRFPETERLAAIFEEDVCLIRAYIFVDGPCVHVGSRRNREIQKVEYDKFIEANRPVCEKLQADGRFFKLDIGRSPRELDADIASIETTLSSIEYMAKLMAAKDVFRPPPPNSGIDR